MHMIPAKKANIRGTIIQSLLILMSFLPVWCLNLLDQPSVYEDKAYANVELSERADDLKVYNP